MSETSNGVRRETKTREGGQSRKTRSGAGRSRTKQTTAATSPLTPFIIAGASVGVAAIAALALASRRTRRRNVKPEGPSFLGTLLRTTAISAARVLTTHLIQNKLAPILSGPARASDDHV
jgi:hypothetical protein